MASRPLPVVRRGRRVLGARGDGADALRDRRGRGGRLRERQAACDPRAARPRPRGARAGSSRGSRTCSASRRASSGDQENLFSAWRVLFERLAEQSIPSSSSSRTCSGRTRACSTSSTTCSTGRGTTRSSCSSLARPELAEKHPSWGAGKRAVTSLYLEPLAAPGDGRALLAGLVPGLPEELRDQILDRAEGVPLYAVETVRMLLDRGLLAHDGTSTGRPGRSRRSRCRRRCTRSSPRGSTGSTAEERRLVQGAPCSARRSRSRASPRSPASPTTSSSRCSPRCSARRCSRSRPIRARPSAASTRSSRTSSSTSPTRRSRSASARTSTSRPRGTWRRVWGARGGRDRRGRRRALPRRLARGARRPTTRTRSRATAREMLVRAAERASSLGATAEAQRAFERAIELADDAVVRGRAARACRASRRRRARGQRRRSATSRMRSTRFESAGADASGRARVGPAWPRSCGSAGGSRTRSRAWSASFEVLSRGRAGRGARDARRAARPVHASSRARSTSRWSGSRRRSISPRRCCCPRSSPRR